MEQLEQVLLTGDRQTLFFLSRAASRRPTCDSLWSLPLRHVRRVAAVAPLLALIWIACGCSPSSNPTQGDAGQSRTLLIACVVGVVGVPFFTSMECGARDAAANLGVELTWQGPHNWDLGDQVRILEAVLQQDPDGVVLAPAHPQAMIFWTRSIMERGIPVVTVDGNLSEPVEVQNIRSDNIAAGAAAARVLGEAVRGRGKVFVVALIPGLTANDERVDGFVDELHRGYPQMQVLPIAYPGTDGTKAAEITAAAIQANPDLVGIYTTQSGAAQGVASAVLAAGKKGLIKVVAYDADPQQVVDLREGLFDALVIQAPYRQGYDSVQLLVQILKGEVEASSVPYQQHSPIVVATRENLNDPEIQKFFYATECR